MTRMLTSAALAGLVLAGSAAAECPSDSDMARLAADILAGTPAVTPPVQDVAEGLCAQAKLVGLLAPEWGAPAGYKAGLTSKPAQEAFKAAAPVRGVLFKDMMLADGARLPARFAAQPRYEADLILVVASPEINQAKTPEEVLRHVAAIHPFIELPDLVVADPRSLTPAAITAINVGARKGVLGAAVPVPDDAKMLAAMQVRVTDATGKELAKAPGAAVLGNPLNAVLWLRGDGVTFQAGDMVSVGSFGPLLVPEAGLTATVTYQGLPGNPSVRVGFD